MKRATDEAVISKIFNHPKVYRMICDDCSIPPFVPNMQDLYVVNESGTGAGLVLPVTGTTCIVHIGCLPELWGKASEFVQDGVDWLFTNTAYNKIISTAPAFNRLSIMLGNKCGFKVEGRITKAFLRNWKLHDLIIFGLSKYDKKGVSICQ